MTEPAEAPTDNPTPDVAQNYAPAEAADDSLELPQNLDQARNLRSENKNLRLRMKAAEEALEQTSTRLTAMQRYEVERLAGADLIDPADVWTANPDVGGFLTDDGTVDTQRVADAAQAITTAKPHLAVEKKTPPPPSNRPIESLKRGASAHDPSPQPTWADAIRR